MVKIKLNPVASAIRDKRVVLVDDSIVRGTTSRRLVGLLRDAGAREVHMRISSPPFLNPCYYGTDVDSRGDLIACRASVSEIAREIGADSLGYLSVNDIAMLAHGECGGGYCTACFSGKYPTEIPTVAKKNRFEQKIGDAGQEDTGD
jgi:amidophosphoribosyltransferase